MINFLHTIKDQLDNPPYRRYEGFLTIFQHLELQVRQTPVVIVETGCCRYNKNAYASDGGSTLLFDRYVNQCSGHVYSVDINPQAVLCARSLVSERTEVTCADSVIYLHKYNHGPIDLLYLDSYDIDWNNPHPASLHHMNELVSARTHLRSGSIIAVDDNTGTAGKGQYVREFMSSVKARLLYSGYQLVWEWP